MCLARLIRLTSAGLKHALTQNKPPVYNAFISHIDEITRLPRGAKLLATNDFTRVQAISVTHKKGTFWATQYHTEYNLHDMARLIVARESKLVAEGFFLGHDDLLRHVKRLQTLYRHPTRRDLRWQLDIEDDILSDAMRQIEFSNWIRYQTL